MAQLLVQLDQKQKVRVSIILARPPQNQAVVAVAATVVPLRTLLGVGL